LAERFEGISFITFAVIDT